MIDKDIEELKRAYLYWLNPYIAEERGSQPRDMLESVIEDIIERYETKQLKTENT